MSAQEILPQAVTYRPVQPACIDAEPLRRFVQQEEMGESRWLGRVLSIVVSDVAPAGKPPRAIIEFADITDEDVGVGKRCVRMPLDVLRASGIAVEALTTDHTLVLDACAEPPSLVELSLEQQETNDATEQSAAVNAWGSVSIKTA